MRLNIFAGIEYLRYLSKSGSRHSVHSPFVYSLVDEVFKNKKGHPAFLLIKDRRNKLLSKSELIEITDFGANSKHGKYEHRFESVSHIVKKSSVSEKYGRVLFRLVEYFKPNRILEMGSSVGLSTMYLAMAMPDSQVYTVEGCTTKSAQAASNFEILEIKNIVQSIGRFDIVLPDLIKEIQKLDFAFIDGNHTYQATLSYFEMLLKISHNDTVFVFDDIHWSAGMKKAWSEITDNERVTVSIDLYRMGIVFLKKELSKQKFVIRL